MNITEARPIIEAHIDANIPVFLSGSPGIGKSDLVRQIAAARGWPVIDKFRASTIDSVDLRGVPSVVNGRTFWHAPDDLPREERDGPEGIVFLDEMNSGSMAVQAAMYQYTLERRIGNHVDPKGWRHVGAGNLLSDKAVTSKLSTALANRFAHFELSPSFTAWKAWAIGANIPGEIIAFLGWCEERGNDLLHKMPEGRDVGAFPTPRSWAAFARVWQVASNVDVYQLAKANVGSAAAIEFKGFLDVYRQLPRPAEIIADPKGCRIPMEPSAMFALTSMLARIADHYNLAALIQYMDRLPVDFSAKAMIDAVTRDQTLKMAPGYAAWAARNGHIQL